MKTHANTYYLITASESEERGRSVAEILIYTLFILSAVASIIAAAAQPLVVPERITVKDCKSTYCA